MKSIVLHNPFARFAAMVCAALALINPLTRAAAAATLSSIDAFDVTAESTINLGTTTALN